MCELSKMAKIWPGDRKTARRAAERPPTARRAVLQPRLPKVAFFGVKKSVFRLETHLSETSSKKIIPIVTGHQKDNIFVLTHCMAGLWGRDRVHFWPKIYPKNCLFSRYTHIVPLSWARTDPTQWHHISPISY